MTMTDPIADFLTRLRNANSAYHDEVSLPHSSSRPTSRRFSRTRVHQRLPNRGRSGR